jgi:hypothetical protein
MPSAEVIEPQSPKALFDGMSHDELRRAGWAEADIKAINDGADLYQVTNARRGLRSVEIAGRQVQTTTVGANRRKPRLTPEAIYSVTDTRDEALRLLRANGFIL